MKRRHFIRNTTLLAGSMIVAPKLSFADEEHVQFMSVLGPVKKESLGITLVHEHIMADFIGAAETGTHRYNAERIIAKALPFLLKLKEAGCTTFIDCTPVYLGRDVRILKRLAEASGMHIFTNTGYYGAVEHKFLPPHAYTETAEQLSARWVKEWEEGIDGTGVRPGLIKTSVDAGELSPLYEKLLTAVAITHLKTGLTISAHTSNGVAALQEISVLKRSGVHASAFRWVHAQNEKDKQLYLDAARQGAWLEFDGINGLSQESISPHIDCLKFMKSNNLLKQTLISQDAGWYWVGERNGGLFRGFTAIFETFLPALKKEGFTEEEIRQLLVINPAESLKINVRRQ